MSSKAEVAPQIIHQLPDEYKHKIDSVFDFVKKHEDEIKKSYQQFYSPKEAADFLRMSVRHLFNLKDELKPSKEGKIVVYRREDLEAFWERRKHKS